MFVFYVRQSVGMSAYTTYICLVYVSYVRQSLGMSVYNTSICQVYVCILCPPVCRYVCL